MSREMSVWSKKLFRQIFCEAATCDWGVILKNMQQMTGEAILWSQAMVPLRHEPFASQACAGALTGCSCGK
jgi:hypothetical protein